MADDMNENENEYLLSPKRLAYLKMYLHRFYEGTEHNIIVFPIEITPIR